MANIGIIGGGIIGISSAYYLTKAGHRVTVFDQSDLKVGCSTGNAGMIVPSHLIPLAAPGMISKGIRWMFDSSSPFYVRIRLSTDLLKWGYQFYRHANKKHIAHAAPALKSLSLFSKSIYQELSKELPFDFGYQERGLMMLFQTAETEKEEAETAQIANQYGIEARILSREEIQAMEPDVRIEVRGGVFFPGDAHLTPQELISQWIGYLQKKDVQLLIHTSITGFNITDNQLKTVHTSAGDYSFDQVVIATGAWSGQVAALLGLNIPMQAGKGYSFTLEQVEKNIRIPSIFLESRVAVTPMGNSLRFGGTMEITGVDHSISMNRVKGIVDSISRYYPDMKVEMPKRENIWHGLRPCSPDGLPYIGRTKKIKNLVVATGHSMMGLSLGPGTGKLVAEIIDGTKTSVDVDAFDPERYC